MKEDSVDSGSLKSSNNRNSNAINPNVILSGNSDQNAGSDEYQEINDNELEVYEQKQTDHKSKNSKASDLIVDKRSLAEDSEPQTALQKLIKEQGLTNLAYGEDEEDEDEDFENEEGSQQYEPPVKQSEEEDYEQDFD
jgi:LysM repeat protein